MSDLATGKFQEYIEVQQQYDQEEVLKAAVNYTNNVVGCLAYV
jgi:hypothetical protein